MSSDDEPDWLVEQVSARKERETMTRLSDSSYSDAPMEDDGSDAEVDASKRESASQGEDGATKAKGKSKGRAPPSSILPLMLVPKVRRDCLLVEADDPSLDLSGDFGVIGKLHVRKGGSAAASTEGASEKTSVAELRRSLMLDLKGKVYDADIVPCNTIALLTVDQSKAKIEGIFSDFVQVLHRTVPAAQLALAGRCAPSHCGCSRTSCAALRAA